MHHNLLLPHIKKLGDHKIYNSMHHRSGWQKLHDQLKKKKTKETTLGWWVITFNEPEKSPTRLWEDIIYLVTLWCFRSQSFCNYDIATIFLTIETFLWPLLIILFLIIRCIILSCIFYLVVMNLFSIGLGVWWGYYECVNLVEMLWCVYPL